MVNSAAPPLAVRARLKDALIRVFYGRKAFFVRTIALQSSSKAALHPLIWCSAAYLPTCLLRRSVFFIYIYIYIYVCIFICSVLFFLFSSFRRHRSRFYSPSACIPRLPRCLACFTCLASVTSRTFGISMLWRYENLIHLAFGHDRIGPLRQPTVTT